MRGKCGRFVICRARARAAVPARRRFRAGRQSAGGGTRAVSLGANAAAGGGGGRAAAAAAAAAGPRRGSPLRTELVVRTPRSVRQSEPRRAARPGGPAAVLALGDSPRAAAREPCRWARSRPRAAAGAAAARLGSADRTRGQEAAMCPPGRGSARGGRADDGREAPHRLVRRLPSVGGAATGGAATRRSARDGGRPAGRRRARGAGAPRRCPTRVRRR